MYKYKLNDLVRWRNCPVPQVMPSTVKGISPDGNWLMLGWIRHPVHISECEPSDDEQARKFNSLYKPVAENQWNDEADQYVQQKTVNANLT